MVTAIRHKDGVPLCRIIGDELHIDVRLDHDHGVRDARESEVWRRTYNDTAGTDQTAPARAMGSQMQTVLTLVLPLASDAADVRAALEHLEALVKEVDQKFWDRKSAEAAAVTIVREGWHRFSDPSRFGR